MQADATRAEVDDDELRQLKADIDKRPGFTPAKIALTHALAQRSRPDDVLALAHEQLPDKPKVAEWILRIGIKELPQNAALASTYCKLADERGDWHEATLRWSTMRKRRPHHIEFHLGYIDCMMRQHRFGEADRAAQSALDFLGDPPALLDLHARIAEARGEWTKAAQRWAAIAERDPHHPQAAANRDHADQQASVAPIAAPGDQAPLIRSVKDDDPAELRELLMNFENLGYNCEFGLVQRRLKAEPVGLLRFAQTMPRTLNTLLRSRFDGFGDPGHMKLSKFAGEYRLAHLGSNWTMHTRIKVTPGVDQDKLLADQLRHSRFLARKLVEDLEEQSKIFVYQRGNLLDQEIDDIHAAMETYGPNRLMCVRVFDHDHPVGSVEWRNDRLMVCAIDRRGDEFPGAGWDISMDYWIHFCRIALQRWETATP